MGQRRRYIHEDGGREEEGGGAQSARGARQKRRGILVGSMRSRSHHRRWGAARKGATGSHPGYPLDSHLPRYTREQCQHYVLKCLAPYRSRTPPWSLPWASSETGRRARAEKKITLNKYARREVRRPPPHATPGDHEYSHVTCVDASVADACETITILRFMVTAGTPATCVAPSTLVRARARRLAQRPESRAEPGTVTMTIREDQQAKARTYRTTGST